MPSIIKKSEGKEDEKIGKRWGKDEVKHFKY